MLRAHEAIGLHADDVQPLQGGEEGLSPRPVDRVAMQRLDLLVRELILLQEGLDLARLVPKLVPLAFQARGVLQEAPHALRRQRHHGLLGRLHALPNAIQTLEELAGQRIVLLGQLSAQGVASADAKVRGRGLTGRVELRDAIQGLQQLRAVRLERHEALHLASQASAHPAHLRTEFWRAKRRFEFRSPGSADGSTGRTDGWRDGWMEGRTDGRTQGQRPVGEVGKFGEWN
eukprot:scaffold1509_cov240-Pinguiococcus_pyrenoidosus.AAC.36